MKKIYNFLSIDSAPLHFTPGRGSEKLDPRPSGMAINNYYDLKEYFIKDNILTESIWYKFFEDYK